MNRLLAGYGQFRSKVFPQRSKLFADLARTQSPQALFITCSDSRVMPEMMMQSEPGDLFPCRNAGNIVPPHTENASGVAATIEYAVRVLKVPDLIVCGHSDCGAMKGLLDKNNLASLPLVSTWLEHAGPSPLWLREILNDSPHWSKERKLQLLTEANVIAQVANLSAHPVVADALKRNVVSVHGWMYDIESGHLRAFDPKQGTFSALLSDAPATISPVNHKQLQAV